MNREYLDAIRDYTRPDLPTELGAMKEFKLRDDEEQSLRRLQQDPPTAGTQLDYF